MKKCNGCNISFNTSKSLCPLCQNILEEGDFEVHFLRNIRLATFNLISKILLFVSLNIILIFGFVEFLITNHLHYSLYVFLGLLTNYIITNIILKNHQNIYRIFGRYILVVIILLLSWYLVTKGKVITNYIIPSVCLFGVLFDFIVGLIMRKNYLVKYSSQILLNIALLFLPLILVFLKLTSNNILAYICSLVSIIFILAYFIFYFNELKDELKKIFNV